MGTLSGRNIVFMPGIDGTGISFEPLRKALSPGIHVQVVQYPPDTLLTFEETVRYAADQVETDSSTILIAESFSGPVAVALVASGRFKPAALILCATFARSPRPLLLEMILHLPLSWLLRLPIPRFLLARITEGGEESADIFLDLWKKVRPLVPPRVLIHRLKIIKELDVRDLLPKLDIPCCYIQATGDRTVPATCLDDFVHGIPCVEVIKIEGPHFILQAKPQLCVEAIEKFLETSHPPVFSSPSHLFSD